MPFKATPSPPFLYTFFFLIFPYFLCTYFFSPRIFLENFSASQSNQAPCSLQSISISSSLSAIWRSGTSFSQPPTASLITICAATLLTAMSLALLIVLASPAFKMNLIRFLPPLALGITPTQSLRQEARSPQGKRKCR